MACSSEVQAQVASRAGVLLLGHCWPRPAPHQRPSWCPAQVQHQRLGGQRAAGPLRLALGGWRSRKQSLEGADGPRVPVGPSRVTQSPEQQRRVPGQAAELRRAVVDGQQQAHGGRLQRGRAWAWAAFSSGSPLLAPLATRRPRRPSGPRFQQVWRAAVEGVPGQATALPLGPFGACYCLSLSSCRWLDD